MISRIGELETAVCLDTPEDIVLRQEMLSEVRERMRVMLRHAELACEFKGERQGIKEMRHNFAWYIKGLRGAARLRGRSGELNTFKDLRTAAEEVIAANDGSEENG